MNRIAVYRETRSCRTPAGLVVSLCGLLAGCRGGEAPRLPHDPLDRCGDGVMSASGTEACDDGNTLDGDGCAQTCALELGWMCTGSGPSTCLAICGDGLRTGREACDDGPGDEVDGCTSTCRIRRGWTCDDSPLSVCRPICGDGMLIANEECDDANRASGDGCDLECRVEAGFFCDAQPSLCAPICGDGQRLGTETCDDGNARDGDGCNALCVRVDRWRTLEPSAADRLPPGGTLLAMADEIFMFGGRDWRPRTFSPATGRWRLVEPDKGDNINDRPVLAFTGREIFVYSRGLHLADVPYPRAFDPRENRWRETSLAGVPDVGDPKVAAWTGSVVLLWGRSQTDGRFTGGRYDPSTDAWSPMSAMDVPLENGDAITGVWTGTELVVVAAGIMAGAYDPVRDAWHTLPNPDPLRPWGRAIVAQAGVEVLALSSDLQMGAAYRPGTSSWSEIPLPETNPGYVFGGFGAVWSLWTGSEVVLVNHNVGPSWRYVPALREWAGIQGLSDSDRVEASGAVVMGGDAYVHGARFEALNHAGIPVWFRLDPVTYSWVELSSAATAAPETFLRAGSVLGNREIIFFGGSRNESSTNVGAPAQIFSARNWAFSLQTGTWTELSQEYQAEPRLDPLLVWSGREVLVWGGQASVQFGGQPRSGGRYDPQLDRWRPMSPGNRSPSLDALAVWSGREMFVWSPPGPTRNDPPFAAYDPETDTWRRITDLGAPEDGLAGAFLSGHEILFHGQSGISRYDLEAQTWHRASMENSPLANVTPEAPPVTTLANGRLLLLVGSELGRYDPALDVWDAIDVPAEYKATLERAGHAIFTGSVAVFLPRDPLLEAGVGQAFESQSTLIGVLYDPATDRWWTTPTSDAPLVGGGRTYTWTGSELVIWGGPMPGGILPL